MPYSILALRHAHKQVLLCTDLSSIATLEDVESIEMVGKYPLEETGWGIGGILADELVEKHNYKLFKKDQFYFTKAYPDYSDLEW